ncbi:hypothetical protein HQ35_03485 [Porphyromonas cangingivalis]|uniref:Uncharacterized protein n=1 Tax=Porphyromonas cangingivalis TaxID=36874 RepID=A0A0A2ESK1_PORCN|nr:hypothetical protein [Porphyromonas cangingivalis]KGN81831.1 hypothetical protein HQ35_03485 [Porphyromonas cangingivalis]
MRTFTIITLFALLAVTPLLNVRGQSQKSAKQALKITAVIEKRYEPGWGWYKKSDSSFVYEKEVGLTLYFRTVKIKEEQNTHGGLELKDIDDLLRDEDFSEIKTYRDLHKRFPMLFLYITNVAREEKNLYKVIDCYAERTEPQVEPVYFFINKTPIKQKDYSEGWIFRWASKNPLDITFFMKDTKESRPTKFYIFTRKPHSTKIISKEECEKYKLTHPKQLWSSFKSDATMIRSAYYYPVVYLIEQRGNNTCYVSEVESWEILYPPAPPPPFEY